MLIYRLRRLEWLVINKQLIIYNKRIDYLGWSKQREENSIEINGNPLISSLAAVCRRSRLRFVSSSCLSAGTVSFALAANRLLPLLLLFLLGSFKPPVSAAICSSSSGRLCGSGVQEPNYSSSCTSFSATSLIDNRICKLSDVHAQIRYFRLFVTCTSSRIWRWRVYACSRVYTHHCCVRNCVCMYITHTYAHKYTRLHTNTHTHIQSVWGMMEYCSFRI